MPVLPLAQAVHTVPTEHGRCVWQRRWSGWRRQPGPSSTRMTRRTWQRRFDAGVSASQGWAPSRARHRSLADTALRPAA